MKYRKIPEDLFQATVNKVAEFKASEVFNLLLELAKLPVFEEETPVLTPANPASVDASANGATAAS